MLRQAVVVISVDVELGWGFRDKKSFKNFFSSNGIEERKNFKKFLRLLNYYNINATFGIVGHLLIEKCSFKNCLCKTYRKHPLLYAPEFLQWILSAPQEHEIASHSFSHIIFDNSSKKSVLLDFLLWNELAKSQKLRLKSFIFPRNRINYLNILQQFNFICYRGVKNKNDNHKISHLLKEFEGPEPSFPSFHQKLVNIPSMSCPTMTSRLLPNRSHLSRTLKLIPWQIIRSIYLQGVRSAVKKAVSQKAVLHLWTHESNLNDEQLILINDILRLLCKMRNKGYVKIMTMGQLGEILRNEYLK